MINVIIRHGKENNQRQGIDVDTNHIVNINYSENISPDTGYSEIVKQAVLSSLQSENVDLRCVVNVLITDDQEIRRYNKKYRDIDKATDVLSFQMQEFKHAGWSGRGNIEIDEETGELPLGDIILSVETVTKQADEYENSLEYETVYMIIHSTLHLLSYDHEDTENEKIMQNRKNSILSEMGYASDK